MTPSVYVYARPWNIGFYSDLATEAFPGHRRVFLSEFKGIGNIWLGDILYKSISAQPIFSDEEMSDIYLRCRFLRSLEYGYAQELIQKMGGLIDRTLDHEKIKLVIGNLIDNFTLDIIERICRRKGINYTSFVPHFFSGYCRLTRRGELMKVRHEVPEDELAGVMKRVVSTDYRPDFALNKPKNRWNVFSFYYREVIKQHLYFQVMKTFKGEKLNYHYNTVFFNKDRTLSNFLVNHESFFLRNPKADAAPSVYIPLHYTPEATVDYWCDDPRCALYEESILQVIDSSSKDVVFWVKEHPAMYYKRSASFYQDLLNKPNVQLLHPYSNSNEILGRCSMVYVYTGSVGVEALLRNKIVFSKTQNYYSDLHPNIQCKDYISREDCDLTSKSYSGEHFLEDLLKGLIPAVFKNDRNIHESDLRTMVDYLVEFSHSFPGN